MRRTVYMILASMFALALCTGCNTSNTTGQSAQQSPPSTESTSQAAPAEAEGSEILEGTWEVAAITYEEKVVPISAVDALADLYDNEFLEFRKDGTFTYRLNVHIVKGHYTPDDERDGIFLLEAETSSRFGVEDDELVTTNEKESDSTYIVVTTDDLENVLGFARTDASTGAVKSGEELLYFKKVGESSVFDEVESDDTDDAYEDTETPEDTSDSSTDSPPPSTSTGTGNQNAVERAERYLQTTSFSHDGLVKQLEYEGFSHEDATYGADACGADWMEQAALKAKQYLQTTSFSESGLVEQLVYEGFTQDEAEYGVSMCGANWMEQAVKKARQYQNVTSLSYSQLVEQLEFEGFTHEQAVYGADNA